MKCNGVLNRDSKRKYLSQVNTCNDDEQHIVHIISGDKFTVGYIKFMEIYFEKYRKTFISFRGNPAFDDKCLTQDKNVIILDKVASIVFDDKIVHLLNSADKIIVSCVSIQNHLVRLGHPILKKCYLQFWGGDFYGYRNIRIRDIRTFKRKVYDEPNLRKCIKNCAGVINLIHGDWVEFQKLFPYDVKHFVAPVPEDVESQIDYTRYSQQKKMDSTYRILIGNSATDTNNHAEVFGLLKKFIGQNIKLIVPLSYGNRQYRNKIIKIGNSIFGDKFVPIIEYMDKTDYVELLSKCDIAIFNNNRQQALGNINIMLSLGKKVYIREDTAMWDYFKTAQITVYNIADIGSATFMEFITANEDDQADNMKKMAKVRSKEYWKELWEIVYEDDINGG